MVHDHTSILKLIETKWNLPALTYRDANADDLLDCLDFERPPAFLEPPTLPAPALDARNPPACTPGSPGRSRPRVPSRLPRSCATVSRTNRVRMKSAGP